MVTRQSFAASQTLLTVSHASQTPLTVSTASSYYVAITDPAWPARPVMTGFHFCARKRTKNNNEAFLVVIAADEGCRAGHQQSYVEESEEHPVGRIALDYIESMVCLECFVYCRVAGGQFREDENGLGIIASDNNDGVNVAGLQHRAASGQS